MRHTLAVVVENRPGVLTRVAGLFSRRGFNIDSLAVGTTQDPSISRMTIVVDGSSQMVDQMVKQLNKLIDVLEVETLDPERAVTRELVLVKVAAKPADRPAIIQIADVFRAKVVDVTRESLILEITGDEAKVEALLELVKDYGIVELVRTGSIALGRGTHHVLGQQEEVDTTWQGSTTTKTPI